MAILDQKFKSLADNLSTVHNIFFKYNPLKHLTKNDNFHESILAYNSLAFQDIYFKSYTLLHVPLYYFTRDMIMLTIIITGNDLGSSLADHSSTVQDM